MMGKMYNFIAKWEYFLLIVLGSKDRSVEQKYTLEWIVFFSFITVGLFVALPIILTIRYIGKKKWEKEEGDWQPPKKK